MRSIETAFKALLGAFLVGDGAKPAGGGWQGAAGTSTFRNYVILKPGPGVTDGPLADPDSQIDRDFFVSCVASTSDGCAILASNVINAVRGARIATATRVTTGPITVDRWGSIDRDDTVQPSVFIATHVFRVDTVPV